MEVELEFETELDDCVEMLAKLLRLTKTERSLNLEEVELEPKDDESEKQ
jgi:hypothetical protein